MKIKISLQVYWILLVIISFYSCQESTTNSEKGFMEIHFSISTLKTTNIKLSDTVFNATLACIVVSIEDLNGSIIKSSEKIELYKVNGNFLSKPLSLPRGNYKLTSFLVLDWKNNVVYISPLKDSPKASFVSKCLPLTFTIQTNMVTKILPEVLNASNNKPEDFGYGTLNFNLAQSFDFLVGTFVYMDSIKNYKITTSNISVYTDTVSGSMNFNPSMMLLSKYDSLGILNKITLPENYNKFLILISKPGYKFYSQLFTKEELKLYFRNSDKGPLTVKLEIPFVRDIDNNVYHPITIGTQTWLLENLKTVHFRNGDLIPHVEDAPAWFAQTTPAYCEYGEFLVYGRLYNFYAVMDSRNICPVGYHVPSTEEWQTLVDYVGGNSIAGGKLKEAGISHWSFPNINATNSCGFTALAAGYRHGGSSDPHYNYKANLTWSSAFWTSTPNLSCDRGYAWEINYTGYNILNFNDTYKGDGLSVRCIKD